MTGGQGDQRPGGAAAPVQVVGAGIVGVACALNLLRCGVPVTLIDHQEPGEGTSFGNAGIIATSSTVPVSVPGLWKKAPGLLLDPRGPLFLRWSYLPRLLPWLLAYLHQGRLAQVKHISANLATLLAGSLEEHQALARGSAAEARIRAQPYAYAYRDRRGFEGDALAWGLRREQGTSWRILEGPAVREEEPALSPDYRCLVVLDQGHGSIDAPGSYVKDLAATFRAEGGRFERRELRALDLADGRIATLQCDDGPLPASRVVITAGAWSARLIRGAGLSIPLESERGYHVELQGPSVAPRHPLMLADRKFVATPMSAGLRLAGLVEFGGLDGPPSAAPTRALLHHAEKIFPGLRYEGHSSWLGHRPATPDSLPVIGGCPGIDNLYLGFGHQHIGLTSGAKTGRWLAELITGQGVNVDISPFSVERFG
jgi:D-amino-acid dehydrogenase